MTRRTIWIAIMLLLFAGGLYWMFGRGSGEKAPRKPPAVAVSTVAARQADHPVVLETNGTVTALEQVAVHPQVSGLIAKVHIREGQAVKAGQLLFTLDARAAEAELSRTRAQLRRDQATLADYERQLARSRELLQQNFISRSAVDTNQSQVEAQRAVVAADRAAVEAAGVALGYNRINAASDGRAGAITVHPGSLVQPGGDPLVTLTRMDPIAVAFDLPQRYLQDVAARMATPGVSVSVRLPGREQPLSGALRFIDSAVDPQTGSVRAKAEFANAGHALWPGAFVTVKAEVGRIERAIVIPAAAIIKSARGDQVFVARGGKAELRPVKVLHSAAEEAVVDGVAAGEQVVVEGKQNLKPGASIAAGGGRAAAGKGSRPDGARAGAGRP